MSWENVIFQYDGSFDGFLCCIYESYVYKEFPIAFYCDEEYDPISFYSVRSVITQHGHAQRVLHGLRRRSPEAVNILYRAFLTCMDAKEKHLYAFVRELFQNGPLFMQNQANEIYHPLVKAIRHLNGELEKLRGFIRFSNYNGVLGSEICPKNRVLPLLRHHFCERYANEAFFIYDRTHRELLMYAKGRSRITSVDTLQLTLPGEEEIYYRTLWKRFYETISIQERFNPRGQNTKMPKRYRTTMTEFLPVDYEHQRQQRSMPTKSHADVPPPCVPIVIPAPETPAGSVLSAPASVP